MKDENRAELLELLETLKTEIENLAHTHADQAQSIAGFAEISTHEATREERNPQLLQLSVKGLAASVNGFELSHPRLVEIVNSISLMLSQHGDLTLVIDCCFQNLQGRSVC